MDAEDAVLDLASHVFNRTHHGIAFSLGLDAGGWRTTQGGLSYTVQVGYRHDRNEAGGFDLQVSLREQPTLDVAIHPQIPQPYFPDLEFVPQAVLWWCVFSHSALRGPQVCLCEPQTGQALSAQQSVAGRASLALLDLLWAAVGQTPGKNAERGKEGEGKDCVALFRSQT
jgi:hypothetical protein